MLIGGFGQRASHNLIHDHPHCAILFTGNDHLIEFNEIHHIALETGDNAGAIYSGRDYTFRGNRIRYTFVHDTGGVGMGRMGIYMDGTAQRHGDLRQRLLQGPAGRVPGRWPRPPGPQQHLRGLQLRGRLDGRGLDPLLGLACGMGDGTMRRESLPPCRWRFTTSAIPPSDPRPGPRPARRPRHRMAPPSIGVAPAITTLSRGTSPSANGSRPYWHATVAMLHPENNLTNAVSSFVRPPASPARATDFARRPDSAAWKLGFQRIPAEKIGLYRDGLRAGLPKPPGGN